jgi:nitrite reductase/ring-hydroxylating ferredoxin subunit
VAVKTAHLAALTRDPIAPRRPSTPLYASAKMRRTREQLVADLAAQGLRFSTFTIDHDSPHALQDWDWNQRDLPHVPIIHGGFRLAPGVVDDQVFTGISLQRILGVRVPLTLAYHHDGPRSRVYMTTLGPMVLVIGADLSPLASGTRVRTTYSVGGPRAASWFFPVVERLLRRNYDRVCAEDEPVRQRRSRLRSWGYRFTVDDHGASYERSLDLTRCNAVPPAGAAPTVEHIELDPGRRQWRIGRDDHLGLRVDLEAGTLAVYPRLCPHEGASLDGCVAAAGALRCPWHGRPVPPLARFDLRSAGEQVRETPHHRLTLAAGALRIEPIGPASVASVG